jgi:hypothetical protein
MRLHVSGQPDRGTQGAVDTVGTGYRVDPEALRLTGLRAGAIAETLDASTSAADGATPQAIAAHPGWQATAGLRACAHAWGTRLTAARENLEQISAKLKDTASAYELAEQDVTAKINRVIGELGG